MKAFSLIELLVTTSILGVLASVSIANYNSYKENANDASTQSVVNKSRLALTAFESDNIDTGSYSFSLFCSDTTGSCVGNAHINGQAVPINDSNIAIFLPGYSHTVGVRLRVIVLYNIPYAANFSETLGYNCKGSRSTSNIENFKKFLATRGSGGVHEQPPYQNNYTLGLNCL